MFCSVFVFCSYHMSNSYILFLKLLKAPAPAIGGGLFGSTAAPAPSTGGLFGSGAPKPASTGLFGATPAAARKFLCLIL